jgi:hypothetical protein
MAPNSKEALKDLRILLVEDSLDNQMLVRLQLERRGAVVETASDGQEGVRMALDGRYDLVLMDMQMPVLDGLEATRVLRKDGFRSPILALTGHVSNEVQQLCREAGCDGHVAKPIDFNGLVVTAQRLTTGAQA